MAATYNFKSMQSVPTSKDLIDVVLSRTQRKTPTVIHARYAIKRIREFYMRKVKFAQQTFRDKLSQIINDFPRLEDIHPFYAELINILYDKDHYKLALGQINIARHIIDNLAKDYVKLMKFGDSLFRCKQLKRAALGRMCTLMRKQSASLAYLEEVRQHLARLPAIDPNTRTLILTGYPNVGKSSFINKVTRANVEVQPYPFTTKSLFVGHMDYKYLKWQVIDTPGILDKPLEERTVIEMQAITALAHLNCCVLYFVDISGQCGHTIQSQVTLFNSIKPLFVNKPLVVVANKIDVIAMDKLHPEDRATLESIQAERNTSIVPMSNVTEEGIFNVKVTACDKLLEHRVSTKLHSKKADEVANRIHITMPKPRDHKERGVFIPESVVAKRSEQTMEDEENQRLTERDLEREHGGPGVYNPDYRKHFLLADPEWKTDIVPEIMDGRNVADFVDPDIDAMLEELEREEDELQRQAEEAGIMEEEEDVDDGLDDEEREDLLQEIRSKKKLMKQEAQLNRNHSRVSMPRTDKSIPFQKVHERLSSMGIDSSKIKERISRRRQDEEEEDGDQEDDRVLGKKRGRSRSRSRSQGIALATLDEDNKGDRSRSRSKSRAASSLPPGADGFRNVKQRLQVTKIAQKEQKKKFGQFGKTGESDRFIGTKMPKHLFSGKRGSGKTDRR
eukprot:TRINITY_DN3120_c0_g1_i1.p1 TRINITY_DN3120_c0_g1~~TRINITY_DN3120_c0_g1_i1.p1  ORF type:complete len:675 (+),score=205.09 TRINITY_DN3120_c0_g1_i1:180-2204(+)